LLFGSGCAKQVIPVAYPPSHPPKQVPKPAVAVTPPTPSPTVVKPQPPAPVLNPRQVAARNLTIEARELLNQEKLTAAIDTLEQSLRLDARNGEAYYYLAEAWHRKGNGGQARQFHRLANTYLESQSAWTPKLQRQAAELGF
jgi:Tfp pilus assembly protein PilF